MSDYEKCLPNGIWLAKRGYVYYLYQSLEAIQHDDIQVKGNLERLNKGIPVFNRCYDGSWLARGRKMKEIKAFSDEIVADQMLEDRISGNETEMYAIMADFFDVSESFSGHSNDPFKCKSFSTVEEMIMYAKKLNRNLYIRYEDWSNGPTSIYKEMFI